MGGRVKKIAIIIFLLNIISGCQTQASNVGFSGTYHYKYEDAISCRLKVLHNSEDSIEFEISCFRGPPSYNSGWMLEKAILTNNHAEFKTDKYGGECEITFDFIDNEIIVYQNGLDFHCGFGHAVYTSGNYKLLDSEIPTLGCMRADNPCNLEISD